MQKSRRSQLVAHLLCIALLAPINCRCASFSERGCGRIIPSAFGSPPRSKGSCPISRTGSGYGSGSGVRCSTASAAKTSLGAVHSEQKVGFIPPPPMEDDGHEVDLSLLHDLLDSGTLRIAHRPPDYRDRRSDGYTEPLEVYVLGTSHVSESSAADVRRVMEVVRPQSVVVELCKSRSGLMFPPPDDGKGEGSAAVGPLALGGESFTGALVR
ncbi:unnamed protein product [Discosporangium mesarthrocarpum]